MSNRFASTYPHRPLRYLQKPVRLPVGREFAVFQLPLTADPRVKQAFLDRKIKLISKKSLMNPGKSFEDTHIGSLKVK